MKIALIGGDARMRIVARCFSEDGTTVATYLLPEGAPGACSSLAAALAGADAVILPLPLTRDGRHVLTEGARDDAPTLRTVFSRAEDETLFFAGNVTPDVAAIAAGAGVRSLVDYYGEEVRFRSAAATAEAAVAHAALHLPIVLSDGTYAVIGGGRIATALLRLLLPLGAHVRLFARSPAQREAAAALGAEALPLSPPGDGGIHVGDDVRAVFCTVPAPVFPAEAVFRLPRGILFYDLGCGAIDRSAAAAHGVLLPPSAGLPGKYAPESAGMDLYRAIRARLAEGKGGILS